MKFILLFTVVVLLASCINSKDERLLAGYEKNNGEKIKIYYVGVGVAANEVIQVRKSVKGKNEILVRVFEKYDYLESSKMLNDTSLQLVINDTGYFKHKPDTFIVSVK